MGTFQQLKMKKNDSLNYLSQCSREYKKYSPIEEKHFIKHCSLKKNFKDIYTSDHIYK